jgi:hypothetical protein
MEPLGWDAWEGTCSGFAMSVVNPKNAQSQIGTLLIPALSEECANLASPRGLSRPEEGALTTCSKELSAARRLVLADARRRNAEGQARSRGFSISRSTGFCRFHQECAIGAHISGNHLNSLDGNACPEVYQPSSAFQSQHGGQAKRPLLRSRSEVSKTASATRKAFYGEIVPVACSPQEKSGNTTFGGYMAISRERIVDSTLMSSSDDHAKPDGLCDDPGSRKLELLVTSAYRKATFYLLRGFT